MDIKTVCCSNLGTTAKGFLTIIYLCTLPACNWVDSTGIQSDPDAVLVFNPSLAQQPDSAINAQALLEFSRQSLPASTIGTDPDNITAWNWGAPYQSGALQICEQFDGFDRQYTRPTLAQACSADSQCALGFNQRQSNSDVVFDIQVPELKASVGVSYQLQALNNDGESSASLITLCLISVNEAPVARNDQFTVQKDATLLVRSNDTVHLLTNDDDDDDIRNRPLRVNPTPLKAPAHALEFELFADGGFRYRPNPSGVQTDDSFIYEVSDGQHPTSAIVELQLVTDNTPPVLVTPLPDIELEVGRAIPQDDPTYNLGAYFRDPEGQTLQFALLADSLPKSGNLSLSARGMLTGRVEPEDVGDYRVSIVASDGSLSTSASFRLSIVNTASATNSPPSILQVPDVLVTTGEFVTIQVRATDADNDRLIYALAQGSPNFLTIDRDSGLIKGQPTISGRSTVLVYVSDRHSLAAMSFELDVVERGNQPPVAEDISNNRVSGTFSYDVSVFFSDPDGDQLTFSSNSLPPGVSLSADGVLSGMASDANRGNHLVEVTATDPFEASASDRFRLTIN